MTEEELEQKVKESSYCKICMNEHYCKETRCANYENNYIRIKIEQLEKENEELKALNNSLTEENNILVKGLGCKTCSIHLEYENLNNQIEELKAQVELNSTIANSFQHKICILEKENAELKERLRIESQSLHEQCEIVSKQVEQIEKMKTFSNCKHWRETQGICMLGNGYCICNKWELAE